MIIKDSGNRRNFRTGAVRDIDESKGRCDLMPLVEVNTLINRVRQPTKGDEAVLYYIDLFIRNNTESSLYDALGNFIDNHYNSISECLLELSVHYKNGAEKYSERNWEKGIPVHSFIDSAIRHYIKYMDDWDDENHKAAFVWNIMGALFTLRVYPELNDISVGDENA